MSRRPDAIDLVARWLARAGLLALWAAAGWGTLLLLATGAGAVRDGLWPALSRLLPAPGAGAWAWLNGLTAALAGVAWLLAAGLLAAARWPRPRSRGEPATAPLEAAPEEPAPSAPEPRVEGRPPRP